MKKHLLFTLVLGLSAFGLIKGQSVGEGIPHHRNLNACYTSDEIDIDGVGDEDAWAAAPIVDKMNFWLNDEPSDEVPDSSDFFVTLQALWDSSAIYLYADITDDVLVKFADHSDWDPWNCDDVEIFLHWRYGSPTGDTAVNGVIFYTETTFQILLNVGATPGSNPSLVKTSKDGQDTFLEDNDPKMDEIEYAFGKKQGGYTLEMKVNFALWDGLSMDPSGTPVPYQDMDSIAFDFSVNDNDDPNTPQQTDIYVFSCDSTGDGLKISWKPNYMGKMTFMHCAPSAVHGMPASSALVNVYPNPVSDILVIEDNELLESVTISNVVGQKVKTIQNLRERKTEVSLSDLKEGIYFVTIRDVTGRTHTSKVLKK